MEWWGMYGLYLWPLLVWCTCIMCGFSTLHPSNVLCRVLNLTWTYIFHVILSIDNVLNLEYDIWSFVYSCHQPEVNILCVYFVWFFEVKLGLPEYFFCDQHATFILYLFLWISLFYFLLNVPLSLSLSHDVEVRKQNACDTN